MIEQSSLCAHISSIVKGNNLPLNSDVVQAFVGELSAMRDSTFKTFSDELKFYLKLILEENVDNINPQAFTVLGFLSNSDQYTIKGTHKELYPSHIPKSRFLRELIHSLDFSQGESQKIVAAFMRLKTFLSPRNSREEPSREDMRKAFNSITHPFDGDAVESANLADEAYALTRRFVQTMRIKSKHGRRNYLPITHHPNTDKKCTYVLPQGTSSMKLPRNELTSYSLLGFLKQESIHDIWKEFPDEFVSSLFIGMDIENATSPILDELQIIHKENAAPLIFICFIPQSGLKERVVAVPCLGLNSLSFPLGKKLKALNSAWKVQGVDSHANACKSIQEEISGYENSGSLYHSIDMSNFTDRFPYHQFLRHILIALRDEGYISQFDVSVMDKICDATIEFPDGLKAKYGVGTPMGTYPSFPLASFGNGIVSTIAYCHAKGIPIDKVRFNDVPSHVVGDDIVIRDNTPGSSIAKEYVCAMQHLGVEVQSTKTLVSYDYAEFCSKLITKHDVYEMRKGDSLYSFHDMPGLIDIYRYYGEPILDHLGFSDTVNNLLKDMDEVPYPYGTGPSLADPVWDLKPLQKDIWGSLLRASEYLDDSVDINQTDFSLIELRSLQNQYKIDFDLTDPPNIELIPDLHPVVKCTVAEVSGLTERLLDSDTPLITKVNIARRIETLCNVIDRFQDNQVVYETTKDYPKDSHLSPSVDIYPRKKEKQIEWTKKRDWFKFHQLSQDLQTPKGGDNNEPEY